MRVHCGREIGEQMEGIAVGQEAENSKSESSKKENFKSELEMLSVFFVHCMYNMHVCKCIQVHKEVCS